MRKNIVVILIVVVFISIYLINNDNDGNTIKTINYNGNNLRVSIDGEASSTLPTSGTYYLVDYTCKSSNTKINWDKTYYKLNVSNGTKKGGVSCYLEFKSNPLLSEMPVGSYVKYTGSNGCVGKSCSGQNANYVSDTDMGYCSSSNYKFIANGWRIGYIEDGSTHLISAGATDCMCTGSSGSSSNSSCSGSLSSVNLYKHFENMNNIALNYCNSDYAKGGRCDNTTSWAMNAADFEKITGSPLDSSSCSLKYSNMMCGYNNSLIDNGGYYWYATAYSASSVNAFLWNPNYRLVDDGGSNYLRGVRPVLSLESSVFVTGGDGTYNKPYEINNYNFRINNGVSYITESSALASIQLSLSGEGVDTMCISVNTSVCTNYVDYSDTYSIDLSSETDGEKIICVYYKDSNNNVIASMSKSVTLDIAS